MKKKIIRRIFLLILMLMVGLTPETKAQNVGIKSNILADAFLNPNSQLKSKHNLHNIFGNFCKLLYVK